MVFLRVLKKISSPVINQLPFFVITYLLFGYQILQMLHGRMVTYDPTVTFDALFTQFGNLFIIVFLWTCLVNLVNKRWFLVFSYFVVLMLYGAKKFIYAIFIFDKITPSLFLFIGETNKNEAEEFVNVFMLEKSALFVYGTMALIALLILMFEWCYRLKWLEKTKNQCKKSIVLPFILMLVCMFSIFSAQKIWVPLFKCTDTDTGLYAWETKICPQDPLSQVVYSFYGIYLMNIEESEFEDSMHNLADDSAKAANNDSLNLVVVIGESYIKRHSALYGYKLQTTPFLCKERDRGNLFTFNDVVTAFNSTSASLKNMFCTNSVSDREVWSKAAFFPTLFRIAGYDVYLWDNQKDMAPNAAFSFALNSFLYNNTITNITYTAFNYKSYDHDEKIVESFDSIRHNLGKQNLIIFHLMGQHVDAKSRYPHCSPFDYFTADSIHRNEPYLTKEKRQEIAEYDNATRYNDYVMSRIIKLFEEEKTVVVYFSDHGEEIYDYRDSKGRVSDNMSKNQVKYIFEIPFMIWCSDSWKAQNAAMVEMIKQSQDRPFMLDNLCHLLFNIGGVETKYYQKARDLLHPDYTPCKRIIAREYDYDEIIGK